MSPFEREVLQISLVNIAVMHWTIWISIDAFADKASPLLFVSPTFDQVSISVLLRQVDYVD